MIIISNKAIIRNLCLSIEGKLENFAKFKMSIKLTSTSSLSS